MAWVYIKGENIPYGCAVCPCHNWEQGFCQVFDDFRAADDDQTKPDWCPLLEVPDHGDLIDRDSLTSVTKMTDGYGEWVTHYEAFEIAEAPVVIPAEKEVKE